MSEAAAPTPTIYLPSYDGCFVCGQKHPTGVCSRFYKGEDGKVHSLFKPNSTHTGFADTVHGGIITAFLDELMWWPVGIATEMICVTVELTVRFRRRVVSGQTYIGTAYPANHLKGPYWDGKAELHDQAGTLLASATGKFAAAKESETRAFADQMTYQPDDLPIFKAPLPK